jgi:hypothetical protein
MYILQTLDRSLTVPAKRAIPTLVPGVIHHCIKNVGCVLILQIWALTVNYWINYCSKDVLVSQNTPYIQECRRLVLQFQLLVAMLSFS